MSNRVSLLERIALSDDLHLASVEELRAFCDDLKRYKSWQILVGRREGDHEDMIEIFVIVPKEQQRNSVTRTFGSVTGTFGSAT